MKNTVKKLLAVALSLIMIIGVAAVGGEGLSDALSALSIRAFADKYGELSYKIKNGKVTITDCNKYLSGDLEIPGTIEGYPVVTIDMAAFKGCTGLTNITIPDSVTSVGIYAFDGCTGLTSITIPASVTSIGLGAFADCTGLTSITVANGNTVYHSAGNCLIKTESKRLISGCKNSVIPDDGSVTNFADSAFTGHTALSSITIPDSVVRIGWLAFDGCTGLTSITIPNSVTSIDLCAFRNCTALTSVNIGNSVTSISENAFWNCTGLTNIAIPSSVTSIGEYAFKGCSAISDIYFAGTQEEWNAIVIEEENEDLSNATIHYKSEPLSQTVKNDTTGISLEFKDYYYYSPILTVVELSDSSIADIIIKSTGGTRQKAYKAYDIIITVNGEETQPKGMVKVKIPLPEGYNPARTFVYHVNTETGKVEKMNAVYENGFMVFETDHFSYYAIVDDTPVTPSNPTASAKLNVKSSTTVDYRSKVNITATASGVPDGYVLAIYDGGKQLAKGTKDSVTYAYKDGSGKPVELTGDKTFTVKVIDANDNVQKDGNGKDLAANVEIKVKSGFFDKLIAFFKGLFGLLPTVEIKP